MIIQDLECYFQELDDTIEEAKDNYEYENFTLSCKGSLDKAIVKSMDSWQDTIIKYHEAGDPCNMMLLMEAFSEKIHKFILDAKVSDSIYKAGIYQLNSCSEIDSTLATRKDYKIFIENKE